VDPEALLVANLPTELRGGMGCSCAGVSPGRSVDGAVRLARNLDWWGGEVLSGLELVVVETGPGQRPFVSFTWPGLVGAVTGMNGAGLTVANLVALKQAGSPAGQVPVLFLLREVLEQDASVDEALARLKATRAGAAQSFALADPERAVAVERGPGHWRVRPAVQGLALVTNYWAEDRGAATDGRYPRLRAALGEGPVDARRLQHALGRVALGGRNLQAVILEPAKRRALVASGRPPVARGEFTPLDLSPWLRPRPTPRAPAPGRP